MLQFHQVYFRLLYAFQQGIRIDHQLLLQGFRKDHDARTAKELFGALPLLTMLGAPNAYKAADNYRLLRSRGITVRKTIDGIIATACIEASLPLLFSDRDFHPYVEHLGLEAA